MRIFLPVEMKHEHSDGVIMLRRKLVNELCQVVVLGYSVSDFDSRHELVVEVESQEGDR